MSLRQALRKAAGLLVELPPEEEAERTETRAASTAEAPGPATDALWAELEKASKSKAAAAPAPPPKTVEQIVREGEGPNLDQIQVASEEVPSLVQPDGTVKFSAIYESAKLPAVPFSSEQIMEMFAALPADLPLDARRQMVKVSINAMGRSIGATPENIVADASRKLAALAAYTDHLKKTTDEYVSLSEQKIALLQAQIEETRKSIATSQQKLAGETDLCVAESHRLDEVLEFFSLDVPPSTYAGTKPEA
jgi:hypothetical protein